MLKVSAEKHKLGYASSNRCHFCRAALKMQYEDSDTGMMMNQSIASSQDVKQNLSVFAFFRHQT